MPRSRAKNTRTMDSSALFAAGGSSVLDAGKADVGATRETERQARLRRLAVFLLPVAAYMWWRVLTGNPMAFGVHMDPSTLMMLLFIGAMVAFGLVSWYMGGKSPHIAYQPQQINVRLDDVKGIGSLREEVVRSVNLFLGHKTFLNEMGGTARRGVLFEGPPGTGKTMMAKAMARESGVPFLFVSATAFQSSLYGGSARRIRNYFKALRKVARRNGGVIGFIEEIDAVGGRRSQMAGMSSSRTSSSVMQSCCGTGGVTVNGMQSGAMAHEHAGTVVNKASSSTEGMVNELLVQMQSFDQPSGWQVFGGSCIDVINAWLPASRQFNKPQPKPVNILVIAATNRADALDSALVRPGRFDRKLRFDLPSRAGRREIIDFYLAKKAHTAALDEDETRDALAAITQGYSPVMIEHLLDEALVNAMRRGSKAMDWSDLETARLTEEVGIGQPVAYTEHEKRLIATHEAGHATVAHLLAPHRRLEILSIIKRGDALGMLAHGDVDEVWTQSRKEMLGFIQISMGGQVAEEIFFGDVSTGPSGDLMSATQVAAQMVGAAGMMDTLISYQAVSNGGFNETNLVGRVLGDTEGRAMVEKVLQDMKANVQTLLADNKHLVEALRDALLERNELIGTEITDVLVRAGSRPTTIDLRDATEVADAGPGLGATEQL
ncbi:MAG: ATPase central domain protein [Frankiales bacterium]|nr:ATPase central domain protein [Frankiales bacterium]